MNLVFNLRKLLKDYKKNLFIVVFLGPDGSGKSSLINKLINEYKCFGFNYHSHIYPKLNIKFANKNFYPYSKKPYIRIISNFKVIFMIIKNFIYYFFTFILKKKGNTIIWCDRYIYDIFADPWRYRLTKSKLSLKLIKKFSLKPDLIFILNPPVNQILKRSSEISKDELINQNKNYDELSKLFPEAILINKEDSINNLSKYCKDYINKILYN